MWGRVKVELISPTWFQRTGVWNGQPQNNIKIRFNINRKQSTEILKSSEHSPFHITSRTGLQSPLYRSNWKLNPYIWQENRSEGSLKRKVVTIHLCLSLPAPGLRCIFSQVPPSATSTQMSSHSVCWRSPPGTDRRRLPLWWGRWSSWGEESILNLVGGLHCRQDLGL